MFKHDFYLMKVKKLKMLNSSFFSDVSENHELLNFATYLGKSLPTWRTLSLLLYQSVFFAAVKTDDSDTCKAVIVLHHFFVLSLFFSPLSAGKYCNLCWNLMRIKINFLWCILSDCFSRYILKQLFTSMSMASGEELLITHSKYFPVSDWLRPHA